METKHTEVNPVRGVFCEVPEMLESEAVRTIVRSGQSGGRAKPMAKTLSLASERVICRPRKRAAGLDAMTEWLKLC